MADQSKREPSATSDDPQHADWVERTATIVSGLLVASLVALLLWDAFRTHMPAEVTATAGKVRAVGSQHYLSVSVENTGDRAVRDVEISVSLTAADSTDEAIFTVDWIPGKSRRHGIAILRATPRLERSLQP